MSRTRPLRSGVAISSTELSNRNLLVPALVTAGVAVIGGVAAWIMLRRRHDQDQARVDNLHPPLPRPEDAEGPWMRIDETVRVDAPADEVYAWWSDLDNLRSTMDRVKHIDRESTDDAVSWRQRGPFGLWTAQWDAEIVHDRKDRAIAWRSMPTSDLPNAGRVRFAPLADEDATAVTFSAEFQPPGGTVGALFTKTFFPLLRRQIRGDLFRVKYDIETQHAVAQA